MKILISAVVALATAQAAAIEITIGPEDSLQDAVYSIHHGDIVLLPGTYTLAEPLEAILGRVTIRSAVPDSVHLELVTEDATIVVRHGAIALEGLILSGREGAPIPATALTIENATLQLRDVQFDNVGRGVSISGSFAGLHCSNTTFRSLDTTGSGGAASITDGVPASFVNCRFESCRASAGGGAIFLADSTLEIIDCEISDCSTEGELGGGAVRAERSQVTISGGAFVNNHAIAADGGAIALINCESRILGVAFDDNTAAGDGGAIYRAAGLFSEHPSMVIGSCQFTGGAAERGSDLFVSDSAAPAVFVNNVVRAGGTAVTPIWADGSGRAAGFLTLANNTIVNDPAAPGFALVLESNGSRVFNNILVGFGPNPVAGTPLSDIRFNLFDGLTPGDQRFDATNIVGDPMFVDAEAGDYHLSSASPAIDAGSNELIPRDHLDGDGDLNTFETLPVDRRLALRIIAANGGGTATVDLGAIEFDPAADPTSCVADFTGDNRLDIADVVLFLQAFGAGCP